jgi:hypothetical protein
MGRAGFGGPVRDGNRPVNALSEVRTACGLDSRFGCVSGEDKILKPSGPVSWLLECTQWLTDSVETMYDVENTVSTVTD